MNTNCIICDSASGHVANHGDYYMCNICKSTWPIIIIEKPSKPMKSKPQPKEVVKSVVKTDVDMEDVMKVMKQSDIIEDKDVESKQVKPKAKPKAKVKAKAKAKGGK